MASSYHIRSRAQDLMSLSLIEIAEQILDLEEAKSDLEGDVAGLESQLAIAIAKAEGQQ